jgi:hypothetical protein
MCGNIFKDVGDHIVSFIISGESFAARYITAL